MIVISKTEDIATLELTMDELLVVRSALNEICNGPDAIEDWEFFTRVGAERELALQLLDELRGLQDYV